MVHNWINIIQDYLIPPTCILCGNDGFDSQDICSDCFADLQKNLHCCYRCAEIFDMVNTSPLLCGHCITKLPAFDETYAPFIHTGVIRYLISALKFNRKFKNARLLGYLLAQYLQKNAQIPELIIAVPLHKQRYRERGFNQSIEIAKTVAKRLSIPINTQACSRIRNTVHQTALPAKQRHKNIKNAFRVTQTLKVHHVAIIDDVMTTGSTVNELAKTLKNAGVTKVDIWVCARA